MSAAGALVLGLALTVSCASAGRETAESWTVAGPPLGATYPYEVEPCFERTRVIGYSQAGAEEGGWFVQDGVFESIAGDEGWELQWYPGGGVEKWADPDYEGWSAPLVSACAGEAPPDRVVLVVGGGGSREVEAIAERIGEAVEVIRAKIPSARRIVLHPVVGGPEGEPCLTEEGDEVRASVGYPLHVAAIERYLERWKAISPESGTDEDLGGGSESGVPTELQVVAGLAPRLQRCWGYADKIGHLKPAAARRIGRLVAEDYVRWDAACAKAGHVACGRDTE